MSLLYGRILKSVNLIQSRKEPPPESGYQTGSNSPDNDGWACANQRSQTTGFKLPQLIRGADKYLRNRAYPPTHVGRSSKLYKRLSDDDTHHISATQKDGREHPTMLAAMSERESQWSGFRPA